MDEWILVLSAGVFIGGLDFIIKGIPKWTDLRDIFTGFIWGLIIILIYILAITALAFAHGKLLLLAGVLAVINEDFFYWVFHWIWHGEYKLKPPLNIPVWFYWFYLVVINGTLLILFEVF